MNVLGYLKKLAEPFRTSGEWQPSHQHNENFTTPLSSESSKETNMGHNEYTEFVQQLIDGGISPAEARKRTFSAYWTRNTRRKPKAEVPAVAA